MNSDEPLYVIRYKRLPFIIALSLFIWGFYFMIIPIFYANFTGGVVNNIMTFLSYGHGVRRISLRLMSIVLIVLIVVKWNGALLLFHFGDILIYKEYFERVSFLPFFKTFRIYYSDALIDKWRGKVCYEGVFTILIISKDYLNTKSAMKYSQSRIWFIASTLSSNTFDEIKNAYNFLYNKIESM
jgi:hypothetical protein